MYDPDEAWHQPRPRILPRFRPGRRTYLLELKDSGSDERPTHVALLVDFHRRTGLTGQVRCQRNLRPEGWELRTNANAGQPARPITIRLQPDRRCGITWLGVHESDSVIVVHRDGKQRGIIVASIEDVTNRVDVDAHPLLARLPSRAEPPREPGLVEALADALRRPDRLPGLLAGPLRRPRHVSHSAVDDGGVQPGWAVSVPLWRRRGGAMTLQVAVAPDGTPCGGLLQLPRTALADLGIAQRDGAAPDGSLVVELPPQHVVEAVAEAERRFPDSFFAGSWAEQVGALIRHAVRSAPHLDGPAAGIDAAPSLLEQLVQLCTTAAGLGREGALALVYALAVDARAKRYVIHDARDEGPSTQAITLAVPGEVGIQVVAGDPQWRGGEGEIPSVRIMGPRRARLTGAHAGDVARHVASLVDGGSVDRRVFTRRACSRLALPRAFGAPVVRGEIEATDVGRRLTLRYGAPETSLIATVAGVDVRAELMSDGAMHVLPIDQPGLWMLPERGQLVALALWASRLHTAAPTDPQTRPPHVGGV